MGAARTINSDVFKTEIQNGKGPAVLDFTAVWCGPCQKLAPAIEQLAAEYAGRVLIGKVDVDEEPEIASLFDVMSVPTILFFQDGKMMDQLVGPNALKIKERIESMLK